MKWAQKQTGFTIVELLIVVVVIAILAAITIVAYNGISTQAKESALKADLKNASTQLHIVKTRIGAFPDNADDLQKSEGTNFNYTSDDNTFCISASNSEVLPDKSFFITESSDIQEGGCAPSALYMQTVTSANCPTTRTVAVDARDNHTYWVQKLADGKCWMLTNLAYAGGGNAAYGDVKTISDGTGGSRIYTEPRYYVSADSNQTTNPIEPSVNGVGGGTAAGGERQYGYHYNWCAAMGVQTSTSACAEATTPLPNQSVSVCPAGWRLPTSISNTGEFQLFINAIGATNNAAGSTNIRSVWLAHYGGRWSDGFSLQGANGYFWSSTQTTVVHANSLAIGNTGVNPMYSNTKNDAAAVRCVAF